MDASNGQKKEKKGLSRAWKKFKDSFKTDQPNVSISSKPTATSTTAKSEPAKPAPIPAAATTTEQKPKQTEADQRLEKARAIFKKYDFEFDEEEWKQSESQRPQPRERVHKPIRMRVKYTCNSCKTSFGRTKTCPNCGSKEYTRYPAKKSKTKAVVEKDPPIEVDTSTASPTAKATTAS